MREVNTVTHISIEWQARVMNLEGVLAEEMQWNIRHVLLAWMGF